MNVGFSIDDRSQLSWEFIQLCQEMGQGLMNDGINYPGLQAGEGGKGWLNGLQPKTKGSNLYKTYQVFG